MKVFSFIRNPDPDDEAVEGERGFTSVNKGLGMQARITNIVIIVGLVSLVGAGLWKYYTSAFARQKETTTPAKVAVRSQPAELPPLIVPPDPPTPARLPAMAPQGAASSSGTAMPPAMTQGPKQPSAKELRLKRQLESPLSFKSTAMAEGDASALVPSTTQRTSIAEAPPGAGGPVAKVSRGGGDGVSKAYLLANPSMVLTRGMVVPCTMLPAIDTTLPGQVTCIQKGDVRSTDGRVVLLEAGTRWVGHQGGGVAQGQNRVGIIWSRGETPNHVLVDVDSDGADALGRPGIDGVVNQHFWDRFGAAIMLSLVSDIGPYLAATRQGGGTNNTTIAFPSVAGGAQSVMSDVLKSTLNISPTLTRQQGAEIIIYVRRDLDFSDVYALQEAK
jgi:type IV secretion system protein VirB10